MATFRTPRGYGVDTVQYRELMEGVRPQASAVPMEAWTGLAPVVVDENHHDPIVIMPGTFVGIASGGLASGKIFPAHTNTGNLGIHMCYGSDDSTWGFPVVTYSGTATAITNGPVPPLGVVYNRIYSFMLQNTFVNYKRNENVGILTDYLIQIPAITSAEQTIQPGQLVQICKTANKWGRTSTITSVDTLMGRLQAWDGTTEGLRFVVGRCYSNITFADGTVTTGKLKDDTTYTLTTAGKAEFKGLERVNTVPGLGVSGTGTKGVPTWLLDAAPDSSGGYHALTILVRL